MDGNYEEEYTPKQSSKQSNILPLWGNERSMNLNPLILTNIQSSHYFKGVCTGMENSVQMQQEFLDVATINEHVNLYELKTYHEVVDEIYYKVTHLEPWEKGSRRTSGQTGMCGGVRGVGAGGIVSTAYCLLYKLFTLKLTRKQLNGLTTHCDSPYIRALGFMYIRYTQPPPNLLDWFEPYLDDTEELDVKAGGGQMMKIGTMLRQWLVKLEWFSTLFPRIPVPIQQRINSQLQEKFPVPQTPAVPQQQQQQQPPPQQQEPVGSWEQREREREPKRDRDWSRGDRGNWGDRDRERDRAADKDREREREYERAPNRDRERDREYERAPDRDRERDREYERAPDREREYERTKDRRIRERSPHKERHYRSSRESDNHGSRERDYHMSKEHRTCSKREKHRK